MDPFREDGTDDDAVVPAVGFGPGREVGPFRILRLLGRGGMGVVWLARDLRLGRRVALKVIEPTRLATPGARERFRREAAATAQLSHPNVVTLYEVGEVDGAPWVALEYIEGSTLRERLADDAPSTREAIAIGHAIASALAAAHHAGILHRDLKPANIILGKDGRPRVVDFGLARRTGERTDEIPRPTADDLADLDSTITALLAPMGDSAAVGTPRFMAPEQWRREETSTAADVWALGLLLHELVHGEHPYHGLDRKALRAAVEGDDPVPAPAAVRAVPPALSDLVRQCLDKRAAARPDADAVVAALGRLLERSGASADESDSPFRGLAAFGERHADAFFGRDAEIAAFLERLREEPVLPVVGPSGAGKSSFVQAGVVPRLRERGWVILHVRPGLAPMAALAHRLVLGELPSGGMSPHTHAADATGSTAPGAPSVSSSSEPRGPARRRLIADADELAARLADEPGRLGLELRATADAQRARVLLFVDQLEELYAGGVADAERRAFLRALVNAADDPSDPVRVVFTLRDDFLGRIAEQDEVRAALSRLTVLRIPGADALRDILTRPAEHAGYRWDDGVVDEMVQQVAASAGGLPLLAFTARQIWHRRDREARRLTRAAHEDLGGVAGALAVHADGVIAGLPDRDERVVRDLMLRLVSGAGTRRVIARDALLAGLPPHADTLLHRLVEARLVTTRRAVTGGAAEVELAHESLIRNWDRLARWIDEGRDDRIFVEHAARAAALWRDRGGRDDDLWQGEALGDARRILGRLGPEVPADVAALLAASERSATRKRRRRRAVIAAIAGALVTVAVVSVIAAIRIAREERRARHRFAEAQREAARAALSGGDLLAARARLRSSLEIEDSVAARGLWLRVSEEPLVWTVRAGAAIYDAVLSPDGDTIAAVGQDGNLRMIERLTGRTQIVPGGGDQLFSVAWSRDGRWIAGGAWDGSLTLWDRAAGTHRKVAAHSGTVHTVAFRGDDELVSISEDGTLKRWDPASDTPRSTWSDGTAAISDLAIAPDGAIVTASWDGKVRRWDDAGRPTVIGTHDGPATAVLLVGDEVISSDRAGTLRGWGREHGRLIGRIDGQVVQVVHHAASGRLVVSASNGRIHLIDVATGREDQPLRGHESAPHALAIAGGLLVSGANDELIRLWDLSTRSRRPDPGHSMTVVGADIARDGKLAISAGYDREARLWDVATGRSVGVLRGHRSRVYAARLLPDGRAITASADGTMRLWEGTGAVAVAPMAMASGHFYDVDASDDGTLVAAAATDGNVHVWWPETGATRVLPVHPDGTTDSVAIDGPGARIAAGSSDGRITVFDVATGAVARGLDGHQGVIAGVAFSPDGRQLASSDENGAVWLWDLETGEGSILWQGVRSYRVAFHPGGELLGFASVDGMARLIDLRGGIPPRELVGHSGEVNEIRFSGDGRIAVTAGNDATIRAWDVATGAPLWRTDRPPTPADPASLPDDLEDLPPVAPIASADGPAGTIALGFASGVLGLWNVATGERLYEIRLNGPVVAIEHEAGLLHATSELGDQLDVDLSALVLPYCELLREVWARVPVIWEGLHPVEAAPPPGHECAP